MSQRSVVDGNGRSMGAGVGLGVSSWHVGPAGWLRHRSLPRAAAGPLRVEPVFVLGIDPGLSRCGYACLEDAWPRASVKAVAMGVLRTPPDQSAAQPPGRAPGRAGRSVAELRPSVVAVEQVFFQVNVRTAMSVGQASGLALAEAAAAGCEVVQYTPNQVKEAVAGWGGAGKEQVQRMVQARLGLASAAAAGRSGCRRPGALPPRRLRRCSAGWRR